MYKPKAVVLCSENNKLFLDYFKTEYLIPEDHEIYDHILFVYDPPNDIKPEHYSLPWAAYHPAAPSLHWYTNFYNPCEDVMEQDIQPLSKIVMLVMMLVLQDYQAFAKIQNAKNR